MFQLFIYNDSQIRGTMTKIIMCVDKIDMGVWKELKYIQGSKKGQHYTVPGNKVLKLPLSDEYIGNDLRIFVQKPESKEEITGGLNEQDIKQLAEMLSEDASMKTFNKWVRCIDKKLKEA